MPWIQRAIINTFQKPLVSAKWWKQNLQLKWRFGCPDLNKALFSPGIQKKNVNKEAKGLSSPCWPGRDGFWSKVNTVLKEKSMRYLRKDSSFYLRKEFNKTRFYSSSQIGDVSVAQWVKLTEWISYPMCSILKSWKIQINCVCAQIYIFQTRSCFMFWGLSFDVFHHKCETIS